MYGTAALHDNRIWSRIAETPDGCWEWQGSRNTLGYGRVHIKELTGRTMVFAHRLVYEILVHDIPDGLEIDHLCKNKACCNPDHLDPVTCAVNLSRSPTASTLAAQATHCPSGHPYDGENLWVWNGIRLCRTCKREQWRMWHTRRREAKALKRASIPCIGCGGDMTHMTLRAKYCSTECKRRSYRESQ
jgi:hypothetical protein